MNYDAEINDFLVTLIELEAIERAALGIAKQVLDKGYASLSPKQEQVFDRYIIAEFTRERCERCGQAIPWSEMYDAYDNGGFCGFCAHMLSKDD